MSEKVLTEINLEKLVGQSLKGVQSDDLEDAAETLKVAILEHIAAGKSPVSGFGNFPALSASYKKVKEAEGATPNPNLELSGDLLDALDVKVKGKKLVVTIHSSQADKAEGNNIGSYGGEPNRSKARRFYPESGESYKSAILSDAKEIIQNALEESNDD